MLGDPYFQPGHHSHSLTLVCLCERIVLNNCSVSVWLFFFGNTHFLLNVCVVNAKCSLSLYSVRLNELSF